MKSCKNHDITEWRIVDNAKSAEGLFQALDEGGIIDKLFTVANNMLGALTSTLVGDMRERVSKATYGQCMPQAPDIPGNPFNRIETADLQKLIEAIEDLALFADINRGAIGTFQNIYTCFIGYCIKLSAYIICISMWHTSTNRVQDNI